MHVLEETPPVFYTTSRTQVVIRSLTLLDYQIAHVVASERRSQVKCEFQPMLTTVVTSSVTPNNYAYVIIRRTPMDLLVIEKSHRNRSAVVSSFEDNSINSDVNENEKAGSSRKLSIRKRSRIRSNMYDYAMI